MLTCTPVFSSFVDCRYYDAGACRSCTLMGSPYAAQVAAKQSAVAAALAPAAPDARWLPAVTGPEQAIWAVTNCAYMRNRFTAVDLLIALGWWRSEDVDEVLSRAEYEVEEAETSHAPR